MMRDEEETLLHELDALDGRLATLSHRQAARTRPPGDARRPRLTPTTRAPARLTSSTRNLTMEDPSATCSASHNGPFPTACVTSDDPDHNGPTPPVRVTFDDPDHNGPTPPGRVTFGDPDRNGLTPPGRVTSDDPDHNGLTPPGRVTSDDPDHIGPTPPGRVTFDDLDRNGLTPPDRVTSDDPACRTRSLTPPCRVNPFRVGPSTLTNTTRTSSRRAHSSGRTSTRARNAACGASASLRSCAPVHAGSRVRHCAATTGACSGDKPAVAARGASLSPTRRHSKRRTARSACRPTLDVQNEATHAAAARGASLSPTRRHSKSKTVRPACRRTPDVQNEPTHVARNHSGAPLSHAVCHGIECASSSSSSRAACAAVDERHCGASYTAPRGIGEQSANGGHSPFVHTTATEAACCGVPSWDGQKTTDFVWGSGSTILGVSSVPIFTEASPLTPCIDDVDEFVKVERRIVEELQVNNSVSAQPSSVCPPHITCVVKGNARPSEQVARVDSRAACVSREDGASGGQGHVVSAKPSLRPAQLLPPSRKATPRKNTFPTLERTSRITHGPLGSHGFEEGQSDYVEHTRLLIPLNGKVNVGKQQLMGGARRAKAAETKQCALTPAAKRATVVLPSMTSWVPRFPGKQVSIKKGFADLKADIASCKSYDYRTPSSSPTSSKARVKRPTFTPTTFPPEHDAPARTLLASHAVSSDSPAYAPPRRILPPPLSIVGPALCAWRAEIPRPPPHEHPAPINTSGGGVGAVKSPTIGRYTWPHSPIESPIPSSRSLSPVAQRTTALRGSKQAPEALPSGTRRATVAPQAGNLKQMALKNSSLAHLALVDTPSEVPQSRSDSSTLTGTRSNSACAQRPGLCPPRHGARASSSSSSECSLCSDDGDDSSSTDGSSASSSTSSSSSSAPSVSPAGSGRHNQRTVPSVSSADSGRHNQHAVPLVSPADSERHNQHTFLHVAHVHA